MSLNIKIGTVAAVPGVTQFTDEYGGTSAYDSYYVYLPGALYPIPLPAAAGTLRYNVGDQVPVHFVGGDQQIPVLVGQGYGTQLDNSSSALP